jgi:hypothetical protein
MSTAANESPEKNPGKKITQQVKRKREFRNSENLKSRFTIFAINFGADV